MGLVHLRSEWTPDIPRELLAGTVVALALIPEVIAFSIIAELNICLLAKGFDAAP